MRTFFTVLLALLAAGLLFVGCAVAVVLNADPVPFCISTEPGCDPEGGDK